MLYVQHNLYQDSSQEFFRKNMCLLLMADTLKDIRYNQPQKVMRSVSNRADLNSV